MVDPLARKASTPTRCAGCRRGRSRRTAISARGGRGIRTAGHRAEQFLILPHPQVAGYAPSSTITTAGSAAWRRSRRSCEKVDGRLTSRFRVSAFARRIGTAESTIGTDQTDARMAKTCRQRRSEFAARNLPACAEASATLTKSMPGRSRPGADAHLHYLAEREYGAVAGIVDDNDGPS